jgi:hypothetical protein
MKNVRAFSKVLFLFCRGYGALMLLVAVYMAGVLLVGDGSGLLVRLPGERFTISYPFSHTAFLIGDFEASSIVIMLSALAGYGLFTWLLGNIFKVFRNEKLFTRQGVKALALFYRVNFGLPILAVLMAWLAGFELKDFIMLAVLHGVIGIFAWFLANIFEQGVALQDEQDQTL